MSLHPILEEKLNAALGPTQVAGLTRRDATLPKLSGKAHAVTGMRRSGKTTHAAAQTTPKLPATLLVLTQEQVIALGDQPVRVRPAYEWMLTESAA